VAVDVEDDLVETQDADGSHAQMLASVGSVHEARLRQVALVTAAMRPAPRPSSTPWA
jgi:hypothetical protein